MSSVMKHRNITFRSTTRIGKDDENANGTHARTRSEKKTFRHHEVPRNFHEPFITSGYRDAGNLTAAQCIDSMFSIHNETFNIWSHLVATLYFIVHFYKVLSGLDDLSDPYVYPLICFAFAICAVFLSSSLAHLFNCISWKARHVCFYLDYASVSIFTFASGQVNYFYCRPANDRWMAFSSPAVYLTVNFCLSFMVFMFCSISRHQWRRYRFILRTGSTVVTWVYDVSPAVVRFLTCRGPQDCNPAVYAPFYRHLLCYAASAICNVSRFPERFMPGVFDIVGYSHHFLHLLTFLGNAYAFSAVYTDMQGRHQVLRSLPQPTVFTSFGYLLLLIACNGACIVYFTSKLDEENQTILIESLQPKKNDKKKITKKLP